MASFVVTACNRCRYVGLHVLRQSDNARQLLILEILALAVLGGRGIGIVLLFKCFGVEIVVGLRIYNS